MLVRFSKIGWFASWGAGLEPAEAAAWSLCCQQYRLGSLGSSTWSMFLDFKLGELESRARLQGRPLPVTPRHVVAGFLESVRLTMDSGVPAVNEGIVEIREGLFVRRCRVGDKRVGREDIIDELWTLEKQRKSKANKKNKSRNSRANASKV